MPVSVSPLYAQKDKGQNLITRAVGDCSREYPQTTVTLVYSDGSMQKAFYDVVFLYTENYGEVYGVKYHLVKATDSIFLHTSKLEGTFINLNSATLL